jgi:hypothetical protein
LQDLQKENIERVNGEIDVIGEKSVERERERERVEEESDNLR